MLKLSARTAQELLEEPITEADWVIGGLTARGERIFWAGCSQDRQCLGGSLAIGLAESMMHQHCP